MKTLNRTLRQQLENGIRRARTIAEKGAFEALERLAVKDAEPWTSMSESQKLLRRRLRARARQLGDQLDLKSKNQEIHRLTQECAYEHWNRLIFARFLAESDLLIEPATQVPISIDECQELAQENGKDWLTLASEFAQRMLPAIFRQGDPVLDVGFTPEIRQQLEVILKELPPDIFHADDSLGWVYQFWQADEKERVNALATKIGARELPAVTQLFTEDYMVFFLLENTIGSWWAAKWLSKNSDRAKIIKSEEELRTACSVESYQFKYLRFFLDQEGRWQPAAGAFDSWPKTVKELKVLDPCMGSGHFLVFALRLLAALRSAEEGCDLRTAIDSVLRDNLFGLEIDPRCTQIAAFNLALSAWKIGGYRSLPSLHVACSGLSVGESIDEWKRLAGSDQNLKIALSWLYELFKSAPTLGSLIDPRESDAAKLVDWTRLSSALAGLNSVDLGEVGTETAVSAKGLSDAAQLLFGRYHLVVTNVPFLSIRRQSTEMRKYIGTSHSDAKACLSATFVERCNQLCERGGTSALVTPQHWLFQDSYDHFRKRLLSDLSWNLVIKLGSGAFETISGEIVNVALVIIAKVPPLGSGEFKGLDCNSALGVDRKRAQLVDGNILSTTQALQLENPDARISFEEHADIPLLGLFARAPQGIITGDLDKWQKFFWELPEITQRWQPFLSTSSESGLYRGREHVVDWLDEGASMIRPRLGNKAIGNRGVAVSQIGNLPVSLYLGELYDGNVAPIVPNDMSNLPALWTFCESESFTSELRKLDKNMKVTNGVLLKVPFDEECWKKEALAKYPRGLPSPSSDDPTQWIFEGHPNKSTRPLQTAVARLLGYRWPRQTNVFVLDCPTIIEEGLEFCASADGIVCIPSLNREVPASERLRRLLGSAFDAFDERALIASSGSKKSTIEDWLREDFSEEHNLLFCHRPFVWQIWDGLNDGFSALVNYHKLAAPNDEGRRTLEKLTYTYLGDWIFRQEQEQKAGTAGADAKVAAAKHLKSELEKILRGDPPYDIFVRWKPLHEQPIGWEPDINDGVRINIRPFMMARTLSARGKAGSIFRVAPKVKWDKDRGKEPLRPKEDYPWFWSKEEPPQDFLGSKEFDGSRWNDLHYTRDAKLQARDRNSNTSQSGGLV